MTENVSRNYRKASYVPLFVLVALIGILGLRAFYEFSQPNAERIQTGESCKSICSGQQHVSSVSPNLCSQLSSLRAGEKRLELRMVLEKRLIEYGADKDELSSNLFFQVTFVLLGLLVVVGRSKTLETPILGIKVPRIWMFYVVPLALLFLWLEFGFLTDKMIQTRSESWTLLEVLSRGEDQSAAAGTSVKANEITRQLARLFEDGSYIDGWFVAFRGCEHVIDTEFREGTNILWSIIYGGLLSLTHALAIFTAHIGNARFGFSSQRIRWRLDVGIVGPIRVLPYFIICVILLSHYQFLSGGDNPNWLQVVVAVGTVIFGWLLIYFGNADQAHGVDKEEEEVNRTGAS